jgi:GT2 family glycosyltransferase
VLRVIVVVIATVGRPQHVADCLSLLSNQTRLPDLVLISATTQSDLPHGVENLLGGLPFELRSLQGPRGLTAQRNSALSALCRIQPLQSKESFVVFFDDDFVPRADWLGNAEAEFATRVECVGLTGVLLADGSSGPGYQLAQARTFLERGRRVLPYWDWRTRPGPARALYGCNMAMRGPVLRSVRFDEALPLYGWLEDEDVSGQLRQQGGLFRSDQLVGVHLGVKGARVGAANYGYSQIANPIYLVRKGTYSLWPALQLMGRNLAANILKSPWPEPHVDRASRLRGNLLALRDLAQGQLHPARAATLH